MSDEEVESLRDYGRKGKPDYYSSGEEEHKTSDTRKYCHQTLPPSKAILNPRSLSDYSNPSDGLTEKRNARREHQGNLRENEIGEYHQDHIERDPNANKGRMKGSYAKYNPNSVQHNSGRMKDPESPPSDVDCCPNRSGKNKDHLQYDSHASWNMKDLNSQYEANSHENNLIRMKKTHSGCESDFYNRDSCKYRSQIREENYQLSHNIEDNHAFQRKVSDPEDYSSSKFATERHFREERGKFKPQIDRYDYGSDARIHKKDEREKNHNESDDSDGYDVKRHMQEERGRLRPQNNYDCGSSDVRKHKKEEKEQNHYESDSDNDDTKRYKREERGERHMREERRELRPQNYHYGCDSSDARRHKKEEREHNHHESDSDSDYDNHNIKRQMREERCDRHIREERCDRHMREERRELRLQNNHFDCGSSDARRHKKEEREQNHYESDSDNHDNKRQMRQDSGGRHMREERGERHRREQRGERHFREGRGELRQRVDDFNNDPTSYDTRRYKKEERVKSKSQYDQDDDSDSSKSEASRHLEMERKSVSHRDNDDYEENFARRGKDARQVPQRGHNDYEENIARRDIGTQQYYNEFHGGDTQYTHTRGDYLSSQGEHNEPPVSFSSRKVDRGHHNKTRDNYEPARIMQSRFSDRERDYNVNSYADRNSSYAGEIQHKDNCRDLHEDTARMTIHEGPKDYHTGTSNIHNIRQYSHFKPSIYRDDQRKQGLGHKAGNRYPPTTATSGDFPMQERDLDQQRDTQLSANSLVAIILKYPNFQASVLNLMEKCGIMPNNVRHVVKHNPHIFNISNDTLYLRPQIKFCKNHMNPHGCQNKESCKDLHICSKYVTSVCKDKNCMSGHSLKTRHNKFALKRYQIGQLNPEQIFKILKISVQSPSGTGCLKFCHSYNFGKCNLTDCNNLHLCYRYLKDSCKKSCKLSHDLCSPHNCEILADNGVDPNESPRDIFMILKEKHPDLFKNQSSPSYHENSDNNQISNYIGYSRDSSGSSKIVDSPSAVYTKQNGGWMPSAGGGHMNSVWSFNYGGDTKIDEICFYSVTSKCRYEDTGCRRLHARQHFHWQIKEHGRGWVNLQKSQVESLERDYCDPSQDFALVPNIDSNCNPGGILNFFGQGRWQANFNLMNISNTNSQVTFPLRRLCSENVDGTVRASWNQWYFLDQNSSWVEYGNVDTTNRDFLVSQITSDDIEKHYLKTPNVPLQFKNRLFTYELDFSNMTQTNTSTNVIRKVKRRPVPHMASKSILSRIPKFFTS